MSSSALTSFPCTNQAGVPTDLRPIESRSVFTDSLLKFLLEHADVIRHDFQASMYAYTM
jgi:hypothetical protein